MLNLRLLVLIKLPLTRCGFAKFRKRMERSEDFFSEFCKTAVVRRATGGRTSCNCGAAAARCTEGERSEPFVQRFGAWRSGGFSAQHLIRSTQFKFSTNFHTKNVRPHYAKPLLAAAFIFSVVPLPLSQFLLN